MRARRKRYGRIINETGGHKMTIQQITLLVMAAVGVALFFAGRIFAKKISSEKNSFIPASMITVRGIAAYFSVVVSWAGAMLAVVCMFLLLG